MRIKLFLLILFLLYLTSCKPPSKLKIPYEFNQPSLTHSYVDYSPYTEVDYLTIFEKIRNNCKVGFNSPNKKSFFKNGTYAILNTSVFSKAFLNKRASENIFSDSKFIKQLEAESKLLENFISFHLHLEKKTNDMTLGSWTQSSYSSSPLSETDFGGVYRLMKLEGSRVFLEIDGEQYEPLQINFNSPQYYTSSNYNSVPSLGISLSTMTINWWNSGVIYFSRVNKRGESIIDSSAQLMKLILIIPGGKQHVFTWELGH